MTIKEFYEKIGGNYSEVLSRLGSDALVKKIAIQFLKDPNFLLLIEGFNTLDAEKAFRAAHTLKGVCSNLGFNHLYAPVYDLTEKLRSRTFDAFGTKELLNEVKQQYQLVIDNLANVE